MLVTKAKASSTKTTVLPFFTLKRPQNVPYSRCHKILFVMHFKITTSVNLSYNISLLVLLFSTVDGSCILAGNDEAFLKPSIRSGKLKPDLFIPRMATTPNTKI